MERNAAQRFLLLDGLRGGAAIGVMLYHIGRALGIQSLAPRGYLAVDFFFVLSGFVIAHAYGDRLAEGRLSPRAFLAIRFLRLWPTAFLGGVIGLAVACLTSAGAEARTIPHFWLIAAANLLMLPNVFAGPAGMFPVNPPHWSLFYELVANFVLAIIAPRLTTRVLAGIVVVSAGFAVVATMRVGNGDYPGVSRLAYSFSVGILIYRLWRAGYRPSGPAIVLLAVLVGALLVPAPVGLTAAAIDAALSLLVFPAIVWLGASARMWRRLEPIATASGDLSYPLYAIHYPIVLLATTNAVWAFSPFAAAWILLEVVCVAGVALGVSHFYDAPMRRAVRRAFAPS